MERKKAIETIIIIIIIILYWFLFVRRFSQPADINNE